MLIDLLLESLRNYSKLWHWFDALRRHVFGRSSEKLHFSEHPQLPFVDLPPLPEVETVVEKTVIERKKHRPTGRGKLPDNLPRHRKTLKPRPEDCVCQGCKREMTTIGEETSEQLDYRPSSLRILETIRPKFACRRCQDQVIIAPLPPAVVPRCLATPSLLAHVVTSKFTDHLPLNRQEGILARHGVDVSRKTMCDWVGRVADSLTPLYDIAKQTLIEGSIIRADDTTVRYLAPPLRQTRRGHQWAYLAGDGRLVVFEFTTDWRADGPVHFLHGFSGKLQADGYKGWNTVARKMPGVVLVGCMAHARRKFHDAKTSDLMRATTGLVFIRRLYQIEAAAKTLSPPERVALRQEQSRPVLDKFHEWMVKTRPSVSSKSPIGLAFTYLDNQWQELIRYLDDGDLSIDNNDTERILRSIAVGRANWLFAGSAEGGRRAAIICTMLASCKLNRIDPYAWLVDVLTRLPTTNERDLAELLPHRWKPTTDIAVERMAQVTEEEILVALSA